MTEELLECWSGRISGDGVTVDLDGLVVEGVTILNEGDGVVVRNGTLDGSAQSHTIDVVSAHVLLEALTIEMTMAEPQSDRHVGDGGVAFGPRHEAVRLSPTLPQKAHISLSIEHTFEYDRVQRSNVSPTRRRPVASATWFRPRAADRRTAREEHATHRGSHDTQPSLQPAGPAARCCARRGSVTVLGTAAVRSPRHDRGGAVRRLRHPRNSGSRADGRRLAGWDHRC